MGEFDLLVGLTARLASTPRLDDVVDAVVRELVVLGFEAVWVAVLDEADQRRKDLRVEFAAWVREVGPAAVAHGLGISRNAMNERLKSYEGTYHRRGTT